MVSSKPILDLPQELIVRISAHLTTVELGQFRRSCKQIESYLFHSFAEELFTKRQFMIEHESLEALSGIANHSNLARNLREVIFDTRILAPRSTPDCIRFMQSRHVNGCLPRDQLLHSGKASTMLFDTFSKLPRLQCIGIRDFSAYGRYRDSSNGAAWGAKWNPWGWTHASDTPWPPLQFSQTDILPLILIALAKAGRYPERLEAVLRGLGRLGRNAFAIPDDESMSKLLGNLKTVMLDIAPEQEEGRRNFAATLSNDEDIATTLYFLPLIRFLHRLSSVEHLRLNWLPMLPFGTIVIQWLAGKGLTISGERFAAKFDRLTALELGLLLIDYEILIKVLIGFPNLKSFALWKLNLKFDFNAGGDNDNAWPRFMCELSARLPKTSQIRKVLFGHVGQEFHSGRTYTDFEVAGILWYQSPPNFDDDTVLLGKVEWDKQNSTLDIHSWLINMSMCMEMDIDDILEDDSMYDSLGLDEESDEDNLSDWG